MSGLNVGKYICTCEEDIENMCIHTYKRARKPKKAVERQKTDISIK